jgi:two-component system response regulator RpaA
MKKILVIDDDPGVVNVLKKRLEVLGHEIETAKDGVSGRALIRTFIPDLIILDIVMPKLDGYSLYQEIRSEYNVQKKPLIVLTGKGELADLFKKEGASLVMNKPFKMEDLLSEVSRLLGQGDLLPPA